MPFVKKIKCCGLGWSSSLCCCLWCTYSIPLHGFESGPLLFQQSLLSLSLYPLNTQRLRNIYFQVNQMLKCKKWDDNCCCMLSHFADVKIPAHYTAFSTPPSIYPLILNPIHPSLQGWKMKDGPLNSKKLFLMVMRYYMLNSGIHCCYESSRSLPSPLLFMSTSLSAITYSLSTVWPYACIHIQYQSKVWTHQLIPGIFFIWLFYSHCKIIVKASKLWNNTYGII